jgi:Uma2 family endonuclease
MRNALDELDELEEELDHVVVLPNVTWKMYLALADARPKSRPRMAYLDGDLEIMSVSWRHESVKKRLARLLEAYVGVRGISADGFGETTYRNKLKRAGLQPDECYSIGGYKPVPDLAIEVVYKHRGVNKLEIYRRLGVGEVWVWEEGAITVHRLVDGNYVEQERSVVIPGIDLFEVSRIILSKTGDTEAAEAYRAALVAKARRSHSPRRKHARATKRPARRG